MRTNQQQPGLIRRAVNDLVMAEMFLVQATIESASAIGDGLSDLGKHLSKEESDSELESIGKVLQRTADEALEPYTSRFKYLRGNHDQNQ